MADRRGFLTGAGAAALTVAAGLPAAATAIFDPATVFDEMVAAGLEVWLCQPVGLDRGAPYYSITPPRGGFTGAHLDLMARWADFLDTHPIEALIMKRHLAEFEGEMGVSRG